MFPIILSQARTQNKEAQRTGSSIPGKERTATLTPGDPNSVKKQVTLRSLTSSPHSPPSSEPNCQPSPRSGSAGHPPDPRLRPPSLPFPGRLQGCTQLPSQKLRWKLRPCSASPSHRGGLPRTKMPGTGDGGWRTRGRVRGGSLRPRGRHLHRAWRRSRGARASLAAGWASETPAGRLAGAHHSHPETRDGTGFLTPGKSPPKLPGKGSV